MVKNKNIKTKNTNKSENKKASKKAEKADYKKLQKEALKLLPMTQSDISKELKIDRRMCSRLMDRMEKGDLIKRTKVSLPKGGMTFMVEKLVLGEVKRDFSALLSGSGKISPCCGCGMDCNPILCVKIDNWIKEDIR